jgi:cyclase
MNAWSAVQILIVTAVATVPLTVARPLLGAQQPDFGKIEIKTTKVASNFYVLVGRGGPSGVQVGPDGVLLVDSQYAPMTDKILAAIRQVSNGPIRFLVNTHVHPGHIGGNEKLAKMGAVILARPELRDRLAHPATQANGAPGIPVPREALPVLTFSGTAQIHMNGEDVALIPVPPAHTDTDAIVYFPKSDVIMAGGVYRSIQYPSADQSLGGHVGGLVEALDAVIRIAGPQTKIVPADGPVAGRDLVVQSRDMIITIRRRIEKLIEEGKTQEQVLAAKPAADYEGKVAEPGDTRDRFISQLYAELKAKR